MNRDFLDYRMNRDYNPVNPFIPCIMVHTVQGQSSGRMKEKKVKIPLDSVPGIGYIVIKFTA